MLDAGIYWKFYIRMCWEVIDTDSIWFQNILIHKKQEKLFGRIRSSVVESYGSHLLLHLFSSHTK